jgi:sulfhydrogenase subunit beta (sulfur reductase)
MTSREDLLKLVSQAIAEGHRVFAPTQLDGLPMLTEIDGTGSIDFDHVLTVNTAKDVLLPRVEALADFDIEDQRIDAIAPGTERTLIFGIRPCDAAGVALLDDILLGTVRDAAYARRRDKSVIVTVGCSRADEACFCTSMGYGPHDETGSDVLVLPRGDQFVLKAITEKGKTFLNEMGIAETSGESDAPPELRRRTDTDRLKEWLDGNFDSPKWRRVSENCVSCGTCYYLCPTCYCFDITDEAGLSRGQRLRIWDCCSFSGFTKMATHQPRVGKHARYRQRIMHKFKYCVDSIGKMACVGDGRCIRHCPYGVDICEVLETLTGEG